MKVRGQAVRTIEVVEEDVSVRVIDQTMLPYEFTWHTLNTSQAVADAIATMKVRGAPLIGVTGAYGVALACNEDPTDEAIERACAALIATRPTAVNLSWAINRVKEHVLAVPQMARATAAWQFANIMVTEDVTRNHTIGKHGLPLLQELLQRKSEKGLIKTLNVMTHCNAGWLATVDWGTALAPIFLAHDSGMHIHVWVSETRPRNQGLLTQWELREHGVPCTMLADNTAGHLMQRGMVDCVIVGADRVSPSGDVANKIGTYLKALSAKDNDIPFFVAAPSSTIDWKWERFDGIEIEERRGDEVRKIRGLHDGEIWGEVAEVALLDDGQPVANPAFDVTPNRLISKIITERGVAEVAGAKTFAGTFASMLDKPRQPAHALD
jgi:methylthioribose-1-phosphate isomerase